MLTSARLNAGVGPNANQTTKVNAARPGPTGTNYAGHDIGQALDRRPRALSLRTSRMIWARTVSAPTRVAAEVSVPAAFSVPPTTRSPGPCHRQALAGDHALVDPRSAVDDDAVHRRSSRRHERARGRPTRTSAIGMSTSTEPRTTRAVFGARPINLRMASEVWLRARASRYRPSRISVMIAAAVSKYSGSARRPSRGRPPGRTPGTRSPRRCRSTRRWFRLP